MEECLECQKQIELILDYAGSEDYMGKQIPSGKFCSQKCLTEHIQKQFSK